MLYTRQRDRSRTIRGIITKEDLFHALTDDHASLWNIRGNIGYVKAVQRVQGAMLGSTFLVTITNGTNLSDQKVAIRFES